MSAPSPSGESSHKVASRRNARPGEHVPDDVWRDPADHQAGVRNGPDAGIADMVEQPQVQLSLDIALGDRDDPGRVVACPVEHVGGQVQAERVPADQADDLPQRSVIYGRAGG